MESAFHADDSRPPVTSSARQRLVACFALVRVKPVASAATAGFRRNVFNCSNHAPKSSRVLLILGCVLRVECSPSPWEHPPDIQQSRSEVVRPQPSRVVVPRLVAHRRERATIWVFSLPAVSQPAWDQMGPPVLQSETALTPRSVSARQTRPTWKP